MTDYALHVKYVRCVTALIKGEVGKIVESDFAVSDFKHKRVMQLNIGGLKP